MSGRNPERKLHVGAVADGEGDSTQAGHGESHGDTMVAETVDLAALEAITPVTRMPSFH